MSLVSVIGAGSLANVFANVLHEFLPEFKLHSVLGRNQEKAEVFASKYSCQAVFNIDDFLKEAARLSLNFPAEQRSRTTLYRFSSPEEL